MKEAEIIDQDAIYHKDRDWCQLMPTHHFQIMTFGIHQVRVLPGSIIILTFSEVRQEFFDMKILNCWIDL